MSTRVPDLCRSASPAPGLRRHTVSHRVLNGESSAQPARQTWTPDRPWRAPPRGGQASGPSATAPGRGPPAAQGRRAGSARRSRSASVTWALRSSARSSSVGHAGTSDAACRRNSSAARSASVAPSLKIRSAQYSSLFRRAPSQSRETNSRMPRVITPPIVPAREGARYLIPAPRSDRISDILGHWLALGHGGNDRRFRSLHCREYRASAMADAGRALAHDAVME